MNKERLLQLFSAEKLAEIIVKKVVLQKQKKNYLRTKTTHSMVKNIQGKQKK